MKRRMELACAWCGVPFVVLFFVGFMLVADFVPPPSPDDSADEIAARFRENTDSIRTGLLICFLGTMFMVTFGAGIIGQTRRIPGVSPVVTQFQTLSVAAAIPVITFPIMIWWVAAFRPEERSADNVQLANDIACMIFVVGFVPYVTWAVSTGLAILSDVGENPLFPRWSGYFSFFVGFAQIPPVLLIFTHTGPFAWDGVVSWWVPMFDFFGWIVMITVLTIRAARRQDVDESRSPSAEASSPRPEMPSFS